MNNEVTNKVNKNRKIYIIIAIILFIICFGIGYIISTSKHIETTKEKEITKVGGWELNTIVTNTIPSDKEKIFKKAIEKYTGAELEPIAYLGYQVVSGTNHMYLVKSTTTTKEAKTTFKVVIVYQNLKKEVEIKDIKDFNIEKYVNKDIDLSKEEATGAWEVSNVAGENSLNKEEKEIFKKATEELTGVNYKPVALLATQVVSGKNYAILATGETVTKEPTYAISIFTIYKDLNDNVETISIANINLADFNE